MSSIFAAKESLILEFLFKEDELRNLIPHTYAHFNDNFFKCNFHTRSYGAAILRTTVYWLLSP